VSLSSFDTLLDGALEDTENRRRFVEIVRANAVRLGSIAADLLVLSELESGVDSPEPEMVHVRGVLEAALLTVDSEARDRQVRLERGELPDLYVAGSRLRLEQALLNLLANAIKFTPKGGRVQIQIEELYKLKAPLNGVYNGKGWVPHQVIYSTIYKQGQSNKILVKNIPYQTAYFFSSVMYTKIAFRVVGVYSENEMVQTVKKEIYFNE